jgi:hypothetical protein
MRYLFLLLTLIFIGCSSTKNLPDNSPKNENAKDSSKVEEEVVLMIENRKEVFPEPIKKSDENDNQQIKERIVKSDKSSVTNTETNLGQVVYKVPDTMQVMKNYEVIVRISKSQTNVEIHNNLNGKVFQKSIKTSNKMQVELIDPTGNSFKVTPVNVQKQLVDSTYTEWRFNVTPLKSGTNKLNLVISIFKDDDVKQIVYSDDIYVRSNPKAEIKSFWYDNWKWFLEKLLIPLASWLFGLWIGRKIKKKRRY